MGGSHPTDMKWSERSWPLIFKETFREKGLLHEADYKGEQFDSSNFEPRKLWFQKKIKSLSLEEGIKPLVWGRDLIQIGFTPGPHFSKILKEAFEMQLEGFGKEEILENIKTYL